MIASHSTFAESMPATRNNSRCIKYIAIASAIIVAFLLFFTPSVAAEPAVYTGKFTCESKYAGSESDIGTGRCFSCSSSHPNRTVFSVTSDKACERPAGINWTKATDRGRGTGLLRTDCPGDAFWDPNGRCYSCPGGFGRSLEYGVTSNRACFNRYGVSRMSASLPGYQGCDENSFRNGLSDNCFTCPAGTYRNANIGSDLTQINACTRCGTEGARPCPVTTLRKSCDKFLAEDFAKGICVKTQAGYVHEAALVELGRYASTILSKAGDALSLSNDDQVVDGLRQGNAQKVSSRTNPALNPCVLDVFNTWTLGGTGETSLIIGGGLETGMAVDVSVQGRSGNQRQAFWYGDASYSLGLSIGSSAGINYGCWTNANNDILGASHGITMSWSDMLGPLPELRQHKNLIDLRTANPGLDFVIGVWFEYDENIKEDALLDIFPIKKGVGAFQGITLTPVFGQGVGIGPQYVRSYTGQFPGKQLQTDSSTSGEPDQDISGDYIIAGTSNTNQFRMVNASALEVRRKGSDTRWIPHARRDARTFLSENGISTYTVNEDGTLTWRSNDTRNIVTTLRKVAVTWGP